MINLHPATISDAEALTRVQYVAVHGPAPSTCYIKSILESWSPSPADEERVNQFRQAIGNNEELFVVAKSVENAVIVGFGSIIVSQQKLDALYVDPAFSRQGVGSNILANLEELAMLHGIDKLYVYASLNAERFYCHHGFLVEQRATHRLRSGMDMDYVKMSKELHVH
jgi:ribosomal protein S18 acetylase RimI-like enzyme